MNYSEAEYNPCGTLDEMRKQRAALELVLLFHRGGEWRRGEDAAWLNFQRLAGVETPSADATSKVLCDVVRRVLGQS